MMIMMMRLLGGGAWCDGKITPLAYMKMLNECNIIMIIIKKNIDIKISKPSETLSGFSGLKYDHNPNLYLHIICKNPIITKGFGSHAIQEIEKIAKLLNFEGIEFSAVNSAIGFYEKQGYDKTDKTCNAKECIMKKILNGGKKKKSNRKTKLNKKNKNKRQTRNKKYK